ncbi:MAG: rhomboid family intramembrane serine protease [Ignavibacteriales bacterium]|nr:rhomboid family intramembrane serine protease [Ignavibacteriales bacterium]
MQCPECNKSLSDKSFNQKFIKFCESCRGFWIPYDDQAGFVTSLTSNQAILEKFKNTGIQPYQPVSPGYCPDCNTSISSVDFIQSGVPVLECEKCLGIWLQTVNIGSLIGAFNHGVLNVSAVYRKSDTTGVKQVEKSFLKSFLGWIEDDIPVNRFPLVTVSLIVINIIVLILQLFLTREDLLELAFVPKSFFNNPLYYWYMPLTSIFMHGGFGHILGNMIYLYLFGDNVEDRIGPVKYLGLYMFVGLISGLAFAFVNADSSIPLLGASGAISGIMGCSLVLYPKSKISFHRMIFFIPFVIRVSVWVYVGLWFVAQQFLGMALGLQGIAYLVHLVGIGSGAIIMFTMRQFDML